ncbi:MAG: hypothetical protein WC343_01660 [Bacilli bacterium]
MNLFSVKKGKALKAVNIILFIWLIGLLTTTFALLVDLVFSIGYIDVEQVKSLIILIGMNFIVAGSICFINKK